MDKKTLYTAVERATARAYRQSKIHLGEYFKYHFDNNLIAQINKELNLTIPQRDVNRICYRVWDTTKKMRKVNPGMKTGKWLTLVANVVVKYLWDELF